jgi:hypothetical protein
MRALTLFVIGALTLGGCANTSNWYYYPDGTLCAKARSTVVGTGETELVVENQCVKLGYSTRDTGISDNGKEALGNIAEGLAKGAVKGIVPVP